jgi:hypothetical protein
MSDAKNFVHIEMETIQNPPYPPSLRIFLKSTSADKNIDALVTHLGISPNPPVNEQIKVDKLFPGERRNIGGSLMGDSWFITSAVFP